MRKKRFYLVAVAIMLAFSTLAAPLAFAAEMESSSSTKADVSTDGVTMSADSDNLTAVTEGCDFAVGEFERASKGSNRDIADAYHGYAYYIGTKSDTLMYMVTSDIVMVYVDTAAAKWSGHKRSFLTYVIY